MGCLRLCQRLEIRNKKSLGWRYLTAEGIVHRCCRPPNHCIVIIFYSRQVDYWMVYWLVLGWCDHWPRHCFIFLKCTLPSIEKTKDKRLPISAHELSWSCISMDPASYYSFASLQLISHALVLISRSILENTSLKKRSYSPNMVVMNHSIGATTWHWSWFFR